MMQRVSRLMPDALAGRIVLLLTVAIIAANFIALAIFSVQQNRHDQQAGEQREIERIVALIPAMEAVAPPIRRVIARDASTRFARVTVGDVPLLRETAPDRRSRGIAARLSDAIGRKDVAVAMVDRPGATDRHERDPGHSQVIALTIPLAAPGVRTQYLNVMTRGIAPRPGGVEQGAFLTVLALSLVLVLSVAILFARRLAKPLGRLADAARAAGRGDRSARVPEDGAREMREAARAFNAMQTEIAQFDAERMRMLAAVGHDLRTPMTGLRIRAELVDDAEQRDAMIRTLDEMAVMANGLVSYGKEGQEGEKMAPLDFGELIEQLCADRDADCNVAPDIQVRGRRVGLGRAVGNLIDNALRYGGDALVTLSRDGENAVLTIDDTGPGIPPERLEAMFQPFRRGEESRNTDTGGAGLGLSIARMIIIAHGGRIALENRANGGLRATVTLPLFSDV